MTRSRSSSSSSSDSSRSYGSDGSDGERRKSHSKHGSRSRAAYSHQEVYESSYTVTEQEFSTTYTETSHSYSYSRGGDDDDDGNKFYLHVNPALHNAPKINYSNCQGRKRALLIGINYFGTENELSGCINDVHNIKNFLIDIYGFKEEDMVILTDDQEDEAHIPTRANIIAGMQWLVNDAQPNDSFFFHFSGHGGSITDVQTDEHDGFDETIYPVDFANYEGDSGQLRDDDMHDLLVAPLPDGCRLTAIFDSCHSGTVLDLPYVYSTKGTLKSSVFKNAAKNMLSTGLAYIGGQRGNIMESLLGIGKQMYEEHQLTEAMKKENSSEADVISFSGCKDDQTSADTHENGRATGAMSYAFTTTLRENPNQSYQELLNNVRDILRDKYSQRPQLSASHIIDVDLPFMC